MFCLSTRSRSQATALLLAAAPLGLLPGTATPSEAVAGGFIEEVVVTAEFRNPTIYDAPVSVSVLNLNDPTRTVTNHLEEVLGWIPNVNLSSGGSRARFIQIRGIGERGQFVEPINPSVGLLVDGVDLSGVGTAASLYDVDQVEVLRGPQGTLYGANALAGLVAVRTRRPTEAWQTRIDLDAGDYDARGLGLATGGRLNDRLGIRLAARHYEDSGFISNRFLGADDTDNHEERTLRAAIDVDLGTAGSLAMSLGLIDVDNGYDAFSLENDRNTRSDAPGRDQQETRYLSAYYETQADGAVRYTAALSYADSDSNYGYDEDWTFVGFHPFEYSSTDFYERERDTLTLDLRALSQQPLTLFGRSTDWVVGLYTLRQDVSLDRTYTFADDFSSAFEIDRLAAYGELTTTLNDRLRLRTGLRLERHESTYRDSAAVRFTPQDDLIGGRIILEYDLDNRAMVYAAITRGYKAGGFNTDGTLDADLRQFDPESLWNTEFGLKGRYVDGRLGVRASLFWMERPDMQVNTSLTRLRENGSSEFIDFTDNAAEGRNLGAEVELDFAATERLDVFAAIGLLDTELEDYVNGAGAQLDGRDQSQAPQYTFFLGAEFQPLEGWFIRAELEGKDQYFTSDSHSVMAPAYELLNMSAGYVGESWQVKLWGRNLTDEDVVVRGFFFPNDPRTGYDPAQAYLQLGEPRRVGVSFSMSL